MNRDEARDVLERTLAKTEGQEVEAVLGGGRAELTRFANNEITQNVSERRYVLSVRVVRGSRTGRATGNDLSDEGVARLVRRADLAARLSPEDPEMLPLPGKQTYRDVDAVDAGTAALGPDARAEAVERAVARCRKAGVVGAGIYESGSGTIGEYGMIAPLAVANTNGLFAWHDTTSARFTISAMDGAASGWASGESHASGDIDPSAIAARAVEKSIRSREPASWEPGPYTVVLEPAAVADLLADAAWLSFGALPVQEGRSFLSGRIGERVLGGNVTIRDDPYHPLHRGAPFDAEGMPTQAVTIVDRGVAKSPVYDRATAAKEGKESTGHGLPYPNPYGPITAHLVLEGGEGGVDELVARVDRGLLVTRVWYTNPIDPKTATLTGMTRDGLFAIEGGRIRGAVRHFRFNQSVVRMLNEVEAMSAVERVGGVVCPGLLVRSFQMSSGTEF